MSRSVAVPNGAEFVAYLDVEEVGLAGTDANGEPVFPGEPGWENRAETFHDETGDEWCWWIGNLQGLLAEWFPSLKPADRAIGREEYLVAENRLAGVVVCEYGGIASLSIVPRHTYADGDWWNQSENLQGQWIGQVERSLRRRLLKAFGDSLLFKIGTASNGESYYRRVSSLQRDNAA